MPGVPGVPCPPPSPPSPPNAGSTPSLPPAWAPQAPQPASPQPPGTCPATQSSQGSMRGILKIKIQSNEKGRRPSLILTCCPPPHPLKCHAAAPCPLPPTLLHRALCSLLPDRPAPFALLAPLSEDALPPYCAHRLPQVTLHSAAPANLRQQRLRRLGPHHPAQSLACGRGSGLLG